MPVLSFHVLRSSPSFEKWFWFPTCMTFEVCTVPTGERRGGCRKDLAPFCDTRPHLNNSAAALFLFFHCRRFIRRGGGAVNLCSLAHLGRSLRRPVRTVAPSKTQKKNVPPHEKPQTRAPSCVQCSLLLVLFHWFILLGRI